MLLHVCRLRCLLQNNSTMRPSPPTHPSSQPSPQHPQPPPPPHSQMMSTQVSLIRHIHCHSWRITQSTLITPYHRVPMTVCSKSLLLLPKLFLLYNLQPIVLQVQCYYRYIQTGFVEMVTDYDIPFQAQIDYILLFFLHFKTLTIGT